MNIRPLHNKVLIERIENSMTTASGIILKRSEEPDRARVVATGPDAQEVSPGDVLLVNWNAATKSGDYFIIPITDIVLVFED